MTVCIFVTFFIPNKCRKCFVVITQTLLLLKEKLVGLCCVVDDAVLLFMVSDLQQTRPLDKCLAWSVRERSACDCTVVLLSMYHPQI